LEPNQVCLAVWPCLLQPTQDFCQSIYSCLYPVKTYSRLLPKHD